MTVMDDDDDLAFAATVLDCPARALLGIDLKASVVEQGRAGNVRPEVCDLMLVHLSVPLFSFRNTGTTSRTAPRRARNARVASAPAGSPCSRRSQAVRGLSCFICDRWTGSLRTRDPLCGFSKISLRRCVDHIRSAVEQVYFRLCLWVRRGARRPFLVENPGGC